MEANGRYSLAIASDTTTAVNVKGARRVIITSLAESDPIYFDFSGSGITDAAIKAQLDAKVTASAATTTAAAIVVGSTIELALGNYPTFNKLAFTCLDSANDSGTLNIVWF